MEISWTKKELGLVAGLLLLISSVSSVNANTPFNAYQTVEVELSGSFNINENMFHDYWSPEAGGGLRISTPFYFGQVEGIMAYWYYYGIEEKDSPSYSNILTVLGWGKEFTLLNDHMALFGGAFVGNSYLSFEQYSFFGHGESEVTAGLYGRASLNLPKDWRFNISVKQTRMFTFHRIDLTYVSLGISRTFNSPSWVKKFFK